MSRLPTPMRHPTLTGSGTRSPTVIQPHCRKVDGKIICDFIVNPAKPVVR